MQHHRVAAAIYDRDSDIPVVFYGLCLSRSHHLFGLIERDRSAIVTDTFVNRHHSLPFVGASQHAINVSEPLRQSDFAERDLWKVFPISSAETSSLRLDVGRPDHLSPLLDFFGNERLEIARRATEDNAAQVGELSLQLGIGEARIDLLVELVDDLGRRLCWCAEAEIAA